MDKKILTLCMIQKNKQILLGMKKRGFGVGFWNGFGGKVLEGESIEEGAIREVREEAGINILELEKRGILHFHFVDKPGLLLIGHIYSSFQFDGNPQESEEMKPRWFDIDTIPYDEMWPGDRYWLPLLLDGKSFVGDFHFCDRTILHYSLTECDKFK